MVSSSIWFTPFMVWVYWEARGVKDESYVLSFSPASLPHSITK